MNPEPVVGRGAVALMLAVFILIVLGILLTHPAGAISKAERPDCLPSQAVEACGTLAGSTDYAGFVALSAQRGASGSRGVALGSVLFRRVWSEAPECSVRSSDEVPKVRVKSAQDAFEVILDEDARLPRKMQWFYVCRGKR